MGLFRDTTIEWQGKEYKFTATMRLLRQIEQEVSIVHVVHGMSIGKAKISHMAFIIASVMTAAGASVTEEEIAAELMSAEPSEIVHLYNTVMNALMPDCRDQKKPNDDQSE